MVEGDSNLRRRNADCTQFKYLDLPRTCSILLNALSQPTSAFGVFIHKPAGLLRSVVIAAKRASNENIVGHHRHYLEPLRNVGANTVLRTCRTY